ncbi:MAG: hypothetical protein GY821_02970, partial [Gammaproteobacteria bacterium]|nr:hypothetical protein [Gammaproteobacteria bacterium]
ESVGGGGGWVAGKEAVQIEGAGWGGGRGGRNGPFCRSRFAASQFAAVDVKPRRMVVHRGGQFTAKDGRAPRGGTSFGVVCSAFIATMRYA